MNNRISPTLIGSFVVGAVGLAVLGTVLFGSGRFFRKTADFIMFFTGSVNGLKNGAAVKFKGVEVGSVKDILLRLPDDWDAAGHFIPVIIELDEDKIHGRGGRLDLDDPRLIDDLIGQGMRARLSAESLVTGVLYVALDLFPDTQAVLVDPPGLRYKEIPAIPTTLARVQSAAEEFIAELRAMKLPELVDSGTEFFDALNRKIESPQVQKLLDDLDPTLQNVNATLASFRKAADNLDENLGAVRADLGATSESAEKALAAASATLNTAKSVLEPGSPMSYQLTRTLEEVAAAARAIRNFAEYLDRNPGALLRGREVQKETP